MRLCTHRIILVCALLARFGLADAVHSSGFYSHARRSSNRRDLEPRQDPPPPGGSSTPGTKTTSILPPVSLPPPADSSRPSGPTSSSSATPADASSAPASQTSSTSTSLTPVVAPVDLPTLTTPPVSGSSSSSSAVTVSSSTSASNAVSSSASASASSPTVTSAVSQSVSTPATSSSAACDGPLCPVSGFVVPSLSASDASSVLATVTATDSAIHAPQSIATLSASDASSVSATVTATDSEIHGPHSIATLTADPSSSATDTATATGTGTATSSDCGVLGCVVNSLLSPSSSDPGTATSSAAAPATNTATATGTVIPTGSVNPSSQPDVPATDTITSVVATVTSPTTVSPLTTVPTTSTVVVTFPDTSGASAASDAAASQTQSPTSTPSAVTPTNFPYLSGSTLVYTSVSNTNTNAVTLTNPDEPTSSFSLIDPTRSVLPSQAPLPTGVPGRIVPMNGVDPTRADLTGFTLVSILFNKQLNWDFVSQNQITSSQIFAYFPLVIENALGIGADDVKTFALQVWVPASYQGVDDAEDLGTIWLAYIPTVDVDTLAAQIKVKQSPFYTASTGIAAELANRVDSSFSLYAVPNPQNSLPNNGGPQSSNSGTSSLARTRQNAIIGVVSTLGAISLIVLAVLVYRSFKRRQELGHHRLTGGDPLAGLRPEGREFDEDSIGGQRRRSFYFAEDSLRAANERQNRTRTPASQMAQRRVLPGTISAPILTQSSLLI